MGESTIIAIGISITIALTMIYFCFIHGRGND